VEGKRLLVINKHPVDDAGAGLDNPNRSSEEFGRGVKNGVFYLPCVFSVV
jgi:hypothetical protein